MTGVYGGFDYAKTTEKLRETLLLTVGNAIKRTLRLTVKDFDIACVYPLTEDEVVYTNFGANYVARYNLQTGIETWRITGYTIPFGIDYNPAEEVFSLSHSGGVAICKVGDGSIVKNITKVGPYTLAGVFAANFNPDNPNELYFTVPTKHVLFKYNHVTGEYTMFGTWGAAKTDYTGLNHPTEVEVDPPNDDVFVVERDNNRVLRFNMAINTVKDLMLLPNPFSIRKARWGLTTQKYCLIVVGSQSGGPFPMYLFGWTRGRRLDFVMPMQLDAMRFSPDLASMWGSEVEGYEFYLDRLKGLFIYKPEQSVILNQVSVTTSGYDSPPLTPFLFGKDVQILLISNKTGTLTVQVPDRVSMNNSTGFLPVSVPTTFTWVDFASISAAVGVTVYNFTIPPPVFRVRFVPSATATVSLFVYFNPKS